MGALAKMLSDCIPLCADTWCTLCDIHAKVLQSFLVLVNLRRTASMSLSISVMRVTKACVVCKSFTHTCVIDPMPIADGQFSSPSSVVGDDGEKVQKTSSRHELKLNTTAVNTVDNIGVRYLHRASRSKPGYRCGPRSRSDPDPDSQMISTTRSKMFLGQTVKPFCRPCLDSFGSKNDSTGLSGSKMGVH